MGKKRRVYLAVGDFWIWLIVFAALAVALGPVFVLLPSKKERRLAALRAEARRLGLSVELQPVPKLGADLEERVTAGGRTRAPMHRSVRYALPLALESRHRPAKETDAAPAASTAQAEEPVTAPASAPTAAAADNWRLLRGPAGWVADAKAPPAEGLTAHLLPLLDQLPDDAVALDRQGRSLGCCWLETFPAQADSVANLKAALTEIAKVAEAWEAEVSSRN